jgi:peroxiredoxin
MKKIMVSFLSISLMMAFGAVAAADGPVVDTAALGGLQLPFNGTEQQRTYLGIGAQPSLCLSQVRADRLIVVIFNTFCSICQTDAEILNFAYDVVEKEPALKGRIKMVGIAAGNTQTEVEQFQDTHKVHFPLFADPDFKVDRAVPENLRTPMLVSLDSTLGTQLRVMRTHTGTVRSVDDVLGDLLLRSAALDMQLARQ